MRVVAIAVALLVAIAVTYALLSLAIGLATDPALAGDDGELTEEPVPLAAGIGLPALTDVTADWGLSDWRTRGENRLRGGVALGDLDSDGRLDVVAAGGSLIAYLNRGQSFERVVAPLSGDAVAVSVADVDADGLVDVLVGMRYSSAAIVWGGDWLDPEQAEVTRLGGDEAFTLALVAADLATNAEGLLDLVQLDYDSFDSIWTQTSRREFRSTELPNSDRQSMALGLGDVDDDGLTDVWVTRDVGWVTGADSVYSRRGDATGRFSDIAKELGADLEIDGMGVTMADLDLDGDVDTYISDLGDNELLLKSGDRYEKAVDRGVAHIRPLGAGDDLISSSWTSGVTDINHDGLLDLVVVHGGFAGRMVPNKIEGSSIADAEAPSILLSNGDGTYTDVWPDLGLDFAGLSRGMALGDLDGDGDSDIVVINHGGPMYVLRNDTPGPVRAIEVTGCSGARLDIAVAGGPDAVTVLPAFGFLSSHAPAVAIGGAVESVALNGQVQSLPSTGLPVEGTVELSC